MNQNNDSENETRYSVLETFLEAFQGEMSPVGENLGNFPTPTESLADVDQTNTATPALDLFTRALFAENSPAPIPTPDKPTLNKNIYDWFLSIHPSAEALETLRALHKEVADAMRPDGKLKSDWMKEGKPFGMTAMAALTLLEIGAHGAEREKMKIALRGMTGFGIQHMGAIGFISAAYDFANNPTFKNFCTMVGYGACIGEGLWFQLEAASKHTPNAATWGAIASLSKAIGNSESIVAVSGFLMEFMADVAKRYHGKTHVTEDHINAKPHVEPTPEKGAQSILNAASDSIKATFKSAAEGKPIGPGIKGLFIETSRRLPKEFLLKMELGGMFLLMGFALEKYAKQREKEELKESNKIGDNAFSVLPSELANNLGQSLFETGAKMLNDPQLRQQCTILRIVDESKEKAPELSSPQQKELADFKAAFKALSGNSTSADGQLRVMYKVMAELTNQEKPLEALTNLGPENKQEPIQTFMKTIAHHFPDVYQQCATNLEKALNQTTRTKEEIAKENAQKPKTSEMPRGRK